MNCVQSSKAHELQTDDHMRAYGIIWVGLKPRRCNSHVLDHLARRWFELHAELKTHTKILKTLTIQTAPLLVEAFGVGFDTAAEMLLAAGENYNRIRSESAFAKLCGVLPDLLAPRLALAAPFTPNPSTPAK